MTWLEAERPPGGHCSGPVNADEAGTGQVGDNAGDAFCKENLRICWCRVCKEDRISGAPGLGYK